MTEGVNAAALDVRNRAGRADLEIAAHERNANRITRAKRLWSRTPFPCASAATAEPAITGTNP